jgi:Flp pilus assembly protein TadG
VTVFVIFYTLIALLLAALLVDGGTAINAEERAGDIAEQAARAAADTVSVPDLRAGQVVIDQSQACASAAQLIRQYVQGTNVRARMTQPCSYPSARQVTVYVTVRATPVFSLFPVITAHAHESACAEFGVAEGEAC